MESNAKPQNSNEVESTTELVQGRDFYFDEGLMVLTSHFLKERGYCCSNQCRHCPYGEACSPSTGEQSGPGKKDLK